MCQSVHVQEEPMGGGVVQGDQNRTIVEVKSPHTSLLFIQNMESYKLTEMYY